MNNNYHYHYHYQNHNQKPKPRKTGEEAETKSGQGGRKKNVVINPAQATFDPITAWQDRLDELKTEQARLEARLSAGLGIVEKARAQGNPRTADWEKTWLELMNQYVLVLKKLAQMNFTSQPWPQPVDGLRPAEAEEGGKGKGGSAW